MTPTRLTLPSPRHGLAAIVLSVLACAGARAADSAASNADGKVSLTGAITGAPGASETATPLSAAETPLVGAWQEGLSAQVRKQLAAMPADRARMLRQRLGDTLVFQADHTMRIYPRCAQAAEFGVSARLGLPAQWRVDESQTLQVTADRGGKAVDRATKFRVVGEELSFFESMASRPQVLGRYDGPLPPDCR